MLKLNFHHLYYFFRIAREGQVARAARRLRIGQPTLSTQLRQFEEFLGYRLFDRKRGQTIALTAQGEILYQYAKEIFRLSDEMLAAADGRKSEGRLSLKIGALDWLPKREVSELVASVSREFDCFVSVYEDTSRQLLEDLNAHKFDLVISNTPPPHSERNPYRARRVVSLPVMIFGGARFAGLREGFPESLRGQPFILPSHHGRTRHVLEDYLETRRIEIRPIGEAQDGELLRRAALLGQALVPLSPSTIEGEIERGELLRIGELENVFEEVWLISMRRLHEHPVVTFLMSQPRRLGKACAA